MQYHVKSFGGVGDGLFDNSTSFALAFKALQPGDTLVVDEGVWLTGPLTLKGSNLTLRLEAGARILFSNDERHYEPVLSRWEGVNCYCMQPCLSVVDSQYIRITGTGTLDGNGQSWWDASRYKREFQTSPVTEMEKRLASLNPGYEDQSGGGGGRQSQFLRPPLLQIRNSASVIVEDITITNSPFWTVHPLYSKDLAFRNLKIYNPKDAPNTDGIDVDSCQKVFITGCLIDVGDDGIALKSGSGPDGIKTNIPTNDILITHCTVKNAHGGAVVGSETAAGIFDVKVSDCLFDGTDRGVRIKTRRGRGGALRNLVFSNIRMEDNLCPLTLNMYYRCGSNDDENFSLEKLPILSTTPSIADVVIRDCVATGCRASAAFIVGLPEEPIRNLSIENCSFSLAEKDLVPVSESEMYQGLPEPDGRGLRLRNVQVEVKNVKVGNAGKDLLIEEGVEIGRV
ncbi:glycoside hydrolase family 28 protein [Sphaerochaeta sp. PS]|uniref:glycoside hydrolase family 28 protein n=1 Tax=Sphaerochaeta sp. PS TaxID=3076336 RepID=UPI0028A46957|nr:glycoside hydrolase family 28 protein [Sphaerochaeta sp. PS]MDT4762421.1 glycoside hydrolase family 28 protein [Sphaerochaeta sp. PS]